MIEEKTTELEKNATLAHSKIHELYEVANKRISLLSGRVGALEETENREGRLGYPSGSQTPVPAKHMVPAKLNKVDDWMRWKIDLEEYAEASMNGLKEALKAVKAEEGFYDQNWFEDPGIKPQLADMKQELWRMLKTYIEPGSEGITVVEGTPLDDGWTAWCKLHEHFEPCLAVREGQVLAELSAMANKSAKTPSETKRFILDLGDKIRKVTDIVGRGPDDMRCKSIVLGFHGRRNEQAMRNQCQRRGQVQ